MIDRRHFIALAPLVMFIAGCNTAPAETSPEMGACDPNAAQALIGEDRITDDEARQLTGATTVRQVEPGDPVTMDYQRGRVTIETDPETDKIVRASCG